MDTYSDKVVDDINAKLDLIIYNLPLQGGRRQGQGMGRGLGFARGMGMRKSRGFTQRMGFGRGFGRRCGFNAPQFQTDSNLGDHKC